MITAKSYLSKMCLWRNEGGFTLAEVMVTMIIFSIASLGLTMLMVSMIGSNDFASRLTEATQLAEDKMEELKNECCLTVEPGTERVGRFTRSWYFVDNNPVVGLLTVNVTVTWADEVETQDAHSLELVALMLPS